MADPWFRDQIVKKIIEFVIIDFCDLKLKFVDGVDSQIAQMRMKRKTLGVCS